MLPVLLLLLLQLTPEGSLRLRAEAATPGTRILLRDLLADGSEGAGDWLDLDLGRAPSPGFPRLLSLESVRRALPDGAPPIEGPNEIVVRSLVRSVPGERLLEEARSALQRGVAPPADAVVEVVRRPRDVTVPRGRVGVVLNAHVRRPAAARGSVTVRVDVLVDGSLRLSVPVGFRIHTFETVPVLAQDIERGQTLTRDAVTLERREVSPTRPAPAVRLDALVGRVARRNLRRGDPVRENDFVRPVLVERNQVVTMIFQRGPLRVEGVGVAKERGSAGDLVRVENLESHKSIWGRVAGPGLVRMDR